MWGQHSPHIHQSSYSIWVFPVLAKLGKETMAHSLDYYSSHRRKLQWRNDSQAGRKKNWLIILVNMLSLVMLRSVVCFQGGDITKSMFRLKIIIQTRSLHTRALPIHLNCYCTWTWDDRHIIWSYGNLNRTYMITHISWPNIQYPVIWFYSSLS